MTFDAFLRIHGLKPGVIRPDGRWRRCPTASHPRKRNGSYKLAVGGTIGWCQNWVTMDSPAQWTAETRDAQPVKIDRGEMLANHRKMQADRQRAIQRAKDYYAACEPLRDSHPYLDAHGLGMRGCYGLRVDGKGWLVVPARSDGDMVSYQRISPEGDKRFARGAPIQGSTYTIDRQRATLTIICEGLATGLALYDAVPDSRVIVCWTANNLTAVKRVRGWRVIAADNDHQTAERIGKNPGIQAAQEAARQLHCGVAYPEGIEGTDWCDYRTEMLAKRRLYPPRFESETKSRQLIDADIRMQIMRHARFRP